MIKFLLILILVIYLVSRFAGYIFRVIYWLTGQTPPHQRKAQSASSATQTKNGIQVIIPQKEQKRGEFKGGDYVDFEEVKEDKK
ncbi:hypothetical protein R9C00_28235 [Flammeovirgaceae bacterium SG7u.111]|nr:hypothetical protein [Flammeovirgaceae bacterium SG7u.132]WPO35590.1 hypothetical protein R9C00_28235 [Flammeovirgaceae bacterium SG7u.111]